MSIINDFGNLDSSSNSSFDFFITSISFFMVFYFFCIDGLVAIDNFHLRLSSALLLIISFVYYPTNIGTSYLNLLHVSVSAFSL